MKPTCMETRSKTWSRWSARSTGAVSTRYWRRRPASGAPLAKTLSKLLTTNQRNLIGAKRGVAASAPLPPDIKRLGPSIVHAYRAAGQRYGVEVSALPGGEQFAELSQKVPRDTALARRTELEAKISAAGVSICADQSSQARNKLTILAR